MLAAVAGHELEARINPELMQSVIEITTPVCRTAADVSRELVKLRGYVTQVARGKGLRVGSAGTHPFSLFERQRITAQDRYRALIDQMQYIARRELIFGMHVHVAVDDPEKAIQVVNGLLPQLAPLLALSASSPFWRGEPTGLASSRQMVFSAFPRSGPPPRFRDYADYAEVVGQLERPAASPTTRTSGGTSGSTRASGRSRSASATPSRGSRTRSRSPRTARRSSSSSPSDEAGEKIPSYHRILTSENKWLAARYGLEAPVMDLGSGRETAFPSRGWSGERSRTSSPTPASSTLSASSRASGRSSSRGTSAYWQLRIYNANRDIVEVAREIADATERLPAPNS